MRSFRDYFLTRTLLGGGLFVALAFSARAHDPGLSSASVLLLPNQVEAKLIFALKDAAQLAPLDENNDGLISVQEFDRNREKFTAMVAEQFAVTFDGHSSTPASQESRLDAKNNVEVLLKFPTAKFSSIRVQSKLLGHLPPGHRQLVSIQKPNSLPIAEQLLGATADTVTAEPGLVAVPIVKQSSFWDFLALGVEHIWTGYDHLLFLFGLLVVTRNFKASLAIITCFTLAHSLTLAVATLNLVQISTRLVEPLIAASIIYVGVENLFSHGEPQGRWVLTFAFGLIHGFGFATVLRELGVGANGTGLALPLIGFNLGVELGQISIAAVVLPLIWKLRTRRVFVQNWVPAASMMVAALGAFWFVQRVWF